jgi:hypothetical protein
MSSTECTHKVTKLKICLKVASKHAWWHDQKIDVLSQVQECW